MVEAQSSVSTHWDVGKVMYRLVYEVAEDSGGDVIGALVEVCDSWIVLKIDNYNSSMYYENTSYQYASYREGKPL